MAIVLGKQYIERIDGLNNEVWIDGERVTGKLSEHPAFEGILRTKGILYDTQHDRNTQSLVTGITPNGTERMNFAFEQPVTVNDLKKRREATQLWARKSCGTVGRSPDYINTAIMTLGSSPGFFEKKYANNVQGVYEQAVKKDLSFTHTFINPQVNRSPNYLKFEFLNELNKKDIIAAKVIDETEEGIVVHGARLLATQGGLTDEVLVLPTGSATSDPSYAYAFAIPSNTKGLKFLCREPYASKVSNSFDHPLTAHFDEIDSVVVFDHVLVPWDRVFLYGDAERAAGIYKDIHLNIMLLFQAVSRQVVKTEYLLGLGEALAQSIAITEYSHVQEKLSEIIITLEIMKALLYRAEMGATKNEFGTLVPEAIPLMTASSYYQNIYPRLVEILHLLGASGFIALPTEKDFQSTVGKDIEQYLQGRNAGAKDRVQLFRLAWDLTMSPFGTRQTQYERFFFGDPVRLSSALYQAYDKKTLVEQVNDFLQNHHGY
ncbi:4-hydroxyphenylacetate 3-monooxygenase [Evansella vedderi]|uniref:4-hydroxyphenylacetate 3-monooxygenase n=1 Tax=Evansella vedderi TaxID=38282 RepID=A0ABT9ZQD7_9BACI|nr:4-hydroxyphenylacetate 3-monooxygenase, oxygenase component [Evansella vedderi]MDQ0253453.1 4-hydroxyphenylacetate 3-monooxygenase [Evansella vedderi]